jgi:hypothetical protein
VGQHLFTSEPKIRTAAGPQMGSYNSSEILISVLRSTSFLLEHYGYSKHDPSLSELQLSLQRATERLAVEARTDDQTLAALESQ